MTPKVSNGTGLVDALDIKVSNGVDAYIQPSRVLESQGDSYKTLWQRKAANPYCLVASYSLSGTPRINTDFNPNNNTRVLCDYECSPATANTPLFGARNASSEAMFGFWAGITSGNARSDFGTSMLGNIDRSLAPFDTRLLLDKNKGETYVDGVLRATQSEIFVTIYPLYLFANNTAGSISNFIGNSGTIKLYGCQIWDNDILVRDFVPVPQNDTRYSSTPAPSHCLWDAVTKQYFVSANTDHQG